MKNLIIYAHPNPASFSSAIKEKVKNTLENKGQSVEVSDLYAEGFNPVLSGNDFASFQSGVIPEDIAKHQELIKAAERLIFVYPVWWNQMPAILKGYIDRVFSYGFAFAFDAHGVPQQLLKGKKGVIFNSYGTPEAYLNGPYSDAMDLTQNQNLLSYCGIETEKYVKFSSVPSTTQEIREAYLESIEDVF